MARALIEGFLRDAAIRGFDEVSGRMVKAERATEGLLGKALAQWNRMNRAEKERAVEIVIAAATAAAVAIAAIRKKRKVRRLAKKTTARAARAIGKNLMSKAKKK